MNYKERANYYCQMADRRERGEQLLLNGDLRIQDTLREAASTIESLLAERDAAVEKMVGDCDECVNADTPAQEYPCYFCRFSVYGKNGDNYYWKWRGPQKGETHD